LGKSLHPPLQSTTPLHITHPRDPPPKQALAEADEEKKRQQHVPGATQEADARKVFVGGFPNATVESVTRRFAKYGDIEEVLIVQRKKKKKDGSSGAGGGKPNAAFVEFCTRAAAAAAALQENGKRVAGGKTLRVSAVQQRQQAVAAELVAEDARVLFVRNLGFDVREHHVRKLFADCGEVVQIRMPKHPDTHAPRGIAFVEFATRAALLAALAKNRSVLKGRAILCTVSEKHTTLKK